MPLTLDIRTAHGEKHALFPDATHEFLARGRNGCATCIYRETAQIMPELIGRSL